MKISRKLKNVLIIEGQKEKVNEFIERLREEKAVLSVKVPKTIDKIDSSYVDSNWNFKKIDSVVLYGKISNTTIFAFSEDKAYEKKVVRIIKGMRISASFTKLVTEGNKGMLVTQSYSDGRKIDEKEELIKPSKYSVAKSICL